MSANFSDQIIEPGIQTISDEGNDLQNDSTDQSLFDSRKTFSSNTKPKQVWAIGGGKGGVGKSLISANLGITLAQSGYKVTAIDLDLGCANLHTCLGVDIPTVTLSDFFSKRIEDMRDVFNSNKCQKFIFNIWSSRFIRHCKLKTHAKK